MKIGSKKLKTIHCPISGEIKPLEESTDLVFASGRLGDGVIILPTDNKVYAPSDACVMFTFPTRHALQLETKQGDELLIHVGINTCTLQGKGFTLYVEPKQQVQQGQLLMEFDSDVIKANALSLETAVLVTNKTKDNVNLIKKGHVEANDELLLIAHS